MGNLSCYLLVKRRELVRTGILICYPSKLNLMILILKLSGNENP
ncbi:hypothetical protein V6Z11_D08G064000 [Gossypium hirsutum]